MIDVFSFGIKPLVELFHLSGDFYALGGC